MPFDEEPEDDGFSRPLPPEDRIWRHPSEVGAAELSPRQPRPVRQAVARTWLVVMASALVGAGTTLVALAALGELGDGTTTVTAVEQVQIPVPKSPSSSDLAVGDAVHPTLAHVRANGPEATSEGTAVVFRSDGHLLTTADAVAAGGELVVTLADGTTLPGTLVGSDDAQDVAVVHVDRADLPTATLALEPATTLGDRTIVVAASERWPEDHAVGVGMVSGIDQWVEVPDGASLHGMVQANVGLNHDATGAALVDVNGAVIGLITLRGTEASEDDGPGHSLEVRYATPIAWVKHLADELVTEGRTSSVWLGIEGTDADDDEVEELGGRGGAKVGKVVEASPADVAGLEPGDIVTAVDDDDVTSMSELIVELRPRNAGEPVELEVDRDGTTHHAVATLAEPPPRP